MTGAKFARKIWWNVQCRIGPTPAHLAFQRVQILNLAHDAKCLSVHKPIDQLATFHRPVLVQNEQRHVFDVAIERVTEGDHLDQRRKEHEEQRHRVAPDDNKFLEQNCAEPAKRFVLHAAFCCSVACLAESSTKTSSSDGPISWISA